MKSILQIFFTLSVAGLLAGCGDSRSSSNTQTPDPATQPEAQAILFNRSIDRAKSLIEAKDYKKAQEVIDLVKTYKLTPEQQTLVDKIQTQIPKNQ